MREITTHKINSANDTIKIMVMDEPGTGGANHRYDVSLPDGRVTHIDFQNGGIAEAGVNGLTHEVLIAICIDRLERFQAGPYACFDNESALNHLIAAQEALQNRTKVRMRRGVEGTHAV